MNGRRGARVKNDNVYFPIYNNATSIDQLYKEVREVMGSLAKKYTYEFIFVNDGSRDESVMHIKKLTEKDKNVVLLNLSRNFGHQAAVTAGLDKSHGDAVIIMDADLQDPPKVCAELIKKWEEGYDVAYAQRRTRRDTLTKRVSAYVYYRLLAALSSVTIPPDTGDFRLADRKVVDAVISMREYHRFLRGMFSYVGFKQVAVPFDRDARHGGKSEYTFKKQIKLAKDGIFGFSDVPLKLVSNLGYTVAFLSVIGMVYAVVSKLFFTENVPGWAMTVVSIFFMGGVQLIMLGVIGEYIGRIYNEARHRPTYLIAEEINTKPENTKR